MESFISKKENQQTTPDIQVPLIVFKLGKEEYGIKIEQVKEVTITPNITPMPQTPNYIRGVANIRGDIIAVMDLEQKLNLFNRSIPEEVKGTYTLVVERENYSIGLIVKEVPQTLNLKASQIEKSPNILNETELSERYIEGIGKLNGRLIIILDILRILNFEEQHSNSLKQD